jgi:hypothetical protein
MKNARGNGLHPTLSGSFIFNFDRSHGLRQGAVGRHPMPTKTVGAGNGGKGLPTYDRLNL